jgi:hypothetical protein
MERIKQAIENAKNPELSREGRPVDSRVHSQYTKPLHSARHGINWSMAKNITAFVLILLAGWLWMRLDFMNQLELIASEYINEGVKQARAEASRRSVDEAKFKMLILGNLTRCQEVAEKDKENYIALVRDAVRLKNEKAKHKKDVEFFIPKASLDKANMMLETAKTECQKIYNSQLQHGK